MGIYANTVDDDGDGDDDDDGVGGARLLNCNSSSAGIPILHPNGW